MVDIRFVPIFGWFLSISHKPRLRPHYIIVVQENNFPLDSDFVRWLFSSATLSFYAFSNRNDFFVLCNHFLLDSFRPISCSFVGSFGLHFRSFFRSIVGSCARSFDRLFVCPFVYVLLNSFSVLMTGGMDPRCKICIFMGKTDPDAPKHKQQVILANTITNVVLVISNFQFLS